MGLERTHEKILRPVFFSKSVANENNIDFISLQTNINYRNEKKWGQKAYGRKSLKNVGKPVESC